MPDNAEPQYAISGAEAAMIADREVKNCGMVWPKMACEIKGMPRDRRRSQ
jgi:hypothetical protein